MSRQTFVTLSMSLWNHSSTRTIAGDSWVSIQKYYSIGVRPELMGDIFFLCRKIEHVFRHRTYWSCYLDCWRANWARPTYKLLELPTFFGTSYNTSRFAKYLPTLAKILHFLTDFCSVLKTSLLYEVSLNSHFSHSLNLKFTALKTFHWIF